MVITWGLLAAVVIPIAAGRRIDRSAPTVPVPAPPVVGDCVGGKFDLGLGLTTPDSKFASHYGYWSFSI